MCGGALYTYDDQAIKIFFPNPMEKDFENQSQWFTIPGGQFIQGLIARYDAEVRVYVVTIQPENQPYECWPRIVSEQ